MDNRPDIRLVDPHPVGARCKKGPVRARQVPFLDVPALFPRKPCVVEAHLLVPKAPAHGARRDLRLVSRAEERKDGPGSAARNLLQRVAEGQDRRNGVEDVRPVWRGSQDPHVPIAKDQILDPVDHGLGSRCGERRPHGDCEPARQGADLPIRGTKTVTPLRDAMRLIDHEVAKRAGAKLPQVRFHQAGFRGGEHEGRFAFADPLKQVSLFLP